MATQSNFDNNIEVEPLLLSSSTPFHNKKVWYKTASAYWLLPMFIVVSLTSGLSVAAEIQLYLRAVCHYYYSRNGQFTSAFSLSSINDTDNDCNNVDVQAITSRFLMALNLCSAIPAIFVLGPLGTLSDRKGRKRTLLISTIGTILITLNLLLVSNFLDMFGIYFFLVGSLVEGLTGGFFSLSEASYAYATDCTSPTRRNVIFGWIQGAMFAGFSIGPTIGGWIVKITDNLLSVYYVKLVINIMLFFFFLLILPESLTEEKLLTNLKRQEELNSTISPNSWINSFISLIYSIFGPLALFLPSDNSKQQNSNDKVPIVFFTKYSSLLLAITYTLLSASIMAMTNLSLLYTSLVFKWSLLEQGYFIFMQGVTKVFVLFILYPILVKFKKQILSYFQTVLSKNFRYNIIRERIVEDDEKQMRRELIFEIWVIRLVLLIDGLSHVAYGLATSGSVFIGVTVVSALGIITTPAIKSLQTNLVAPSQIGRLLGAISVIDSILRIAVPLIFDSLYSILVKTSPNLIWYYIAALLFIGCIFSFGVGPK
ncbi:major facilitator superfamily domain-containing protein [Glomus cerebriforme]|uniref:Major facilitator superfamily domain-containing protein n=1 Tax=Glomus cerebriforme TaxID=658196 RepID=A0A397THF0_9GLOM|nr:major facilitator superfamily domain-containing protein [Glomus cerebriforme]